jgi:hypothetical protein
MLTGKPFELRTPTIAIDSVDGKRVTNFIPAGAIIKVVSGPLGASGDGEPLIDVLWEGRTVSVFAIDATMRGTEVEGVSAGLPFPVDHDPSGTPGSTLRPIRVTLPACGVSLTVLESTGTQAATL